VRRLVGRIGVCIGAASAFPPSCIGVCWGGGRGGLLVALEQRVQFRDLAGAGLELAENTWLDYSSVELRGRA
jgi:hypothetical protein